MRAPVDRSADRARRRDRCARATSTILDRISLDSAAGRADRADRAERRRQDHAAARSPWGLIAPTAGRVTWGGRDDVAADAARHRVPAPGDAAPQRRRQYRATRSRPPAWHARERAARSPSCSTLVGLDGLGRPAGAAAVRRRAAAAGAGARAGARSRGAVPRRADREPRSGRHQGDRGRRARGRRARHQGRDGDARSRRGATARRRDRAAASRPRDRERRRPPTFFAQPATPTKRAAFIAGELLV